MNAYNKIARIAGLLNLVIAVLAPFSILYVPSRLIQYSDGVITAQNIASHEMLFRLASVSAIIVHITQILYAVLLYVLFKPGHKICALSMLLLSLTGVSVAIINELNWFAVLALLNAHQLQATEVNQQVMFYLHLHSYGIIIAQIFWGLWLFPLGYLVARSGYVPRILGVLLMVAGTGYVVDSFGKLLIPNYSIAVSSFTFIGELLFTLWLLIKGVNVQSMLLGDKNQASQR